MTLAIFLRPSIFQFTPLREGRLRADGFNATFNISIHAPPRGATDARLAGRNRPHHFNSRPSARGDVFRITSDARDIFQFTPLREGRPDGYAPCEVIFFISIHAPPRGATRRSPRSFSR